jgi:hypothetical protein
MQLTLQVCAIDTESEEPTGRYPLLPLHDTYRCWQLPAHAEEVHLG